MKEMIQIDVRNSSSHQTIWVDTEKKFKVGDHISLKDQDGLWEVLKIHPYSRDKSSLYKPWKVGGLE